MKKTKKKQQYQKISKIEWFKSISMIQSFKKSYFVSGCFFDNWDKFVEINLFNRDVSVLTSLSLMSKFKPSHFFSVKIFSKLFDSFFACCNSKQFRSEKLSKSFLLSSQFKSLCCFHAAEKRTYMMHLYFLNFLGIKFLLLQFVAIG